MNHRPSFHVRNDVRNAYVFNTVKTAAENEHIIGKILYDFVYSSLNLIIFYRGLYSKESFSTRPSFGLQLPLISQTENPDVVSYIRIITEKIVNFHIADLLEGFAYEEANRRTRERIVLKFHYFGSINLTPPTFEEFHENLGELKESCKNLLFDLKRNLRAMEPSQIIPKPGVGGKIEKQRRKPKWKVVIGLKPHDGMDSTSDVNNTGVFKNDPDWDMFPWKKSKTVTTTKISEEDSPLNEMARIISETENNSNDPVFYYDSQDVMNTDYYEEGDLMRDCEDDIKPLFVDDPDGRQPIPSEKKVKMRNITTLNNDDNWDDVSENQMLNNNKMEGSRSNNNPSSSTTTTSTNPPIVKSENLCSNDKNLITVVTIDDSDDEGSSISSSPIFPLTQLDPVFPQVLTQADPAPPIPEDMNCGSPDMFSQQETSDPLEIFQDLEEQAAQETSIKSASAKISKDGEDISVTTEKQVKATPSNSLATKEKRTCLKMFSISSVQMLDTLMCNILLLNYPPKVPVRNNENSSNNPLKKQTVMKKRRVLVFD